MKIWDSQLSFQKPLRHSKKKIVDVKKEDDHKFIKKKISVSLSEKRPSNLEIRNKLKEKFGSADLNGEFRLAKEKAESLAKQKNGGTYALKNALKNGTVNFSEKEKAVLSQILGKRS